MSEIVINAQNLSKNFYNFDSRLPFIKRFLKRNQITIRAVQDISFTIKRGSIVGFIGSNGAGKSTTIKMLTGTLYPSSGKLEVNGEIPFKRSINFRKKISIVVGNKLQLFQDVSAMDYFQLIGTLYEVEPAILQERIQELSNLLNVKDQLYQQVRTLSLGQKMKMEFIAASLTSPEILFLDEPTIGLDIQSKKDIRTFLKKMNEECHTTIILTSHDMDDISSVCDELIVIDKGKIILQESMDVILSKFSDFKYSIIHLLQNKTVLERVDGIIAHNDKMKSELVKMGIKEDKIVSLEIFDYLIPNFNENKNYDKDKILLAGNFDIRKTRYARELPEKPEFEIYGINFESENLPNNVHYKGEFTPDELPNHLQGGFGLVWDGDSAQTCSGMYGEYLKINNPHKASLYLASGFPIIVWSQSALADFVRNKNCGILVNSLFEIAETLKSISEDEYKELIKNSKRIGRKIRQGHYLKTALEKCERKL